MARPSECENVAQLILGACREFAERPALQTLEGDAYAATTYGELASQIRAVAAFLDKKGLRKGDRVGLYAPNSPAWAPCALGAMAAGAALVPLDARMGEEELAFVASDSRMSLAFAAPELVEKARSCLAGVELVPLDSRDEAAEPVELSPGDVAVVSYTSGTTGRSKGVVLTHGNFLSNVDSIIDAVVVGPKDRILSVLPLSHVFEFAAGLLTPLSRGCTITYVREISSQEILLNMQKTRTTVMVGVPLLYKVIYRGLVSQIEKLFAPLRWYVGLARRIGSRWPGLARVLLGSVHRKFGGRLRYWVAGGAPIDPGIIRGFGSFGIRILQGYGLSEAAPVVSVCTLDEDKVGTVGKPLRWAQVKINEPDENRVGEIWVRGGSVMKGYLNNPEATDEAVADGWLRTGDLGRLDEEGFLTICGRVKDLIVTEAGKNVHPEEVEEAIALSPYVKEVCVFGRKRGYAETVHAVVVPDTVRVEEKFGRKPEELELRRLLADELAKATSRLAPYKHAVEFEVWSEELPKTRTAKVRRAEVAHLAEGRRAARPKGGPSAPEEERLIEIVSEMTGLSPDELGPDSELALDSLMRVELCSRLELELGGRIPEELIARCRTVKELASAFVRSRPPGKKSRAHSLFLQRFLPVSVARFFSLLALRAFARSRNSIEADGLRNIPRRGKLIFAANHNSHFDTMALLASLPLRRLWMTHPVAARDVFYRNWLLGLWASLHFNCIPFDRKSNPEAGLEGALAALRRGGNLIVFPEGWRGMDARVDEFKPGVGYLAMEAQVPVVPAYIQGTERVMPKGRATYRPGKVRVSYGAPVEPGGFEGGGNRFERYIAFASRVREEVLRLGASRGAS